VLGNWQFCWICITNLHYVSIFVPVKRLVITNVQNDRFFLLSRAALNAYRNFGLGRGYRLGGGSLGGFGGGFLSRFVGCFLSCFGGWFRSRLRGWFGGGLRSRFRGGLGSGLGGGLRGCPLSRLGGWLGGWYFIVKLFVKRSCNINLTLNFF
jgi:hypothetical protein